MKRYESKIYRLGMRMLRSPQDAEDLLQKTFLSVFEKMHTFRGEAKFSTWIYRIATNHALMKLRKEKKRTLSSINAPIDMGDSFAFPQLVDEEADLSEYFEKKELLGYLEDAINKLPDIYRLVFILRDLEGLSNKEVAQIMDLSVPAVKSRILRARLQLREILKKRIGRGA